VLAPVVTTGRAPQRAALLFSTPGLSVAVVAVTVAGVLGGVTPPGPAPSSHTVAAVVGLGVLHALLGTASIYVIERRGTRALLYAHFTFALAVGVTAIAVSRGYASLLVLSLICQSVLYLPTLAVVCVTAACAATTFAVYLADGTSAFHVTHHVVGWTSSVPFVVAFSQVLVRQRRGQAEVERLAAELGEANERLRAHASDVEELATTKERNRIAREIHDGLGHFLTVVHVQLEAAQAMLGRDPDQARTAITKAQALTREGLDEVRRSVTVLRGSTRGAIAAESLVLAIEKLASECTTDGLAVRVELRGTPRRLSDSVVFTLYRAVQEALTNVRRHARASNVGIRLAFLGPDRLQLRVEDDGVGADAPQGGFGLVGLRERAALCGGKVSVSTARGGGFVLEVELTG
jgi:signal transduction histidine kinase